MKTSITLSALAVCAVIARPATAATVTFTLDLQKLGAGNFELRAQSSAGDNGGISSYNVPLTNVATVNNNSLRSAAAQNADGSLEGPVGFTLLRTADDTTPATVGPLAIAGSQDTITPTPFLIHGMGQTAGNLASRGITTLSSKEGDPWAADMIVAVGMYTPGVFPAFNSLAAVSPLANVFNATSGYATSAATIETTTIHPDGSRSFAGFGSFSGPGSSASEKGAIDPSPELPLPPPPPKFIEYVLPLYLESSEPTLPPHLQRPWITPEWIEERMAQLLTTLAAKRSGKSITLAGGVPPSAAAVPEPSSWVIAIIGGLLCRRAKCRA